ncbi:MAG: hypothetical protein ACKOX7_07020 [Bacteroidota bacterium]
MKIMNIIYTMALCLFLSNLSHAQDRTSAIRETDELKPVSSSEQMPSTHEPAHIIGDDGQKVYFLVDPSKVKNDGAHNSTKTPNGSIQPKSKPD